MIRQEASARAGGRQPGRASDWPVVAGLAAIEDEVLRRWADQHVVARSLARTAGGAPWACFESPAAASGMPGLHHLPGWTIRDLYQRFKTMQGYHVPRQGGWDCHGLPVEVAVERELRLLGRAEIDAYGVARFNARCRESAVRHAEAFAALMTRMGYWAGPEQAYRTMDARYIESVWWSLRQIFDAGLLIRDDRVTPYCPRCQTPLSEHELGMPGALRSITGRTVTVRFPLLGLPDGANPWLRGADLLVRTAAPWTLVPAVAIAVHPHRSYVVARRAGGDDRVVVAEELATGVLGEGWHVAARLTGAELAGATYRPPFSLASMAGADGAEAHRVITGYFVPADSGTGLTLVAPCFGTADMQAGREHGLAVVDPIGPDGRFGDELPLLKGVFFAAADPILADALADRRLLLSAHDHQRSHPHCWRCGTPLLHRAMSSWYIRTTAVGDPQASSDWRVSRSRYWGTPLPLWECERGHVTCVASLAELSDLAGSDLRDRDPHRPAMDLVTIACPRCGATAPRVADVVDPWYDAGSMPFARHADSPARLSQHEDDNRADLIVDDTQGPARWSQALMTVGTLVFGHAPFGTALRLGPLLDDHGRPMTRGLGNTADPQPLIARYGADALRWFAAATASPVASRKVSAAALTAIVRKVLLTYWSTASFFARYLTAWAERGTSWHPDGPGTPLAADRPLLDRWILAELHDMVGDVTAAFESFEAARAGARISGFVDDLSNWYLRRSRRRFRQGPQDRDGAAAFATMYECLDVLTRVMAPIAPFLTDYVWDLTATCIARGPDSVHLADWPVPAFTPLGSRRADDRPDNCLAAQMELARRIADLGRSARAAASIRVRQPLGRALISADGIDQLSGEFLELIADELNVRAIDLLATVSECPAEITVKPNFGVLGPRLGKDTAAVAAAISSADPRSVVASLDSLGTFTVDAGGARLRLTAGDVLLTRRSLAGWSVATAAGAAVALDTLITPDLRREGLAREVIRTIQSARRADHLALGDQVTVRWSTEDRELAAALTEHQPSISAAIRASDLGQQFPGQRPEPGTREHVTPALRLTFWLARSARVKPAGMPG